MTQDQTQDHVMKGRCLCGDISWEYTGEPTWNALCHCESCRRASSAPVLACIGALRAQVTWTGTPAIYRSSPGVERLFCPRCGSPMAFRGEAFPDEIFLYAGSLEDQPQYTPTLHTHHGERVPWLELADNLPTLHGSNDEAKG
ncbi:MAG: GFA family protein [Pseudomonadota bacterium]